MLQLMLQPSCEALIENKNMGRKERKERKRKGKGKEHTERCSPGKIYMNKNISELLARETVARFTTHACRSHVLVELVSGMSDKK